MTAGLLLVVTAAFAIPAVLVVNVLPLEVDALIYVGQVLMVVIPFGYTRNNYLMRQQLDEFTQLSEIVQDLQSANTMQDLLGVLETKLPRILGVGHLLISLVDRDTRMVDHVVVVRDGQAGSEPEGADISLVGDIIKAKRPKLLREDVPTYLTDTNKPAHQSTIGSWMGAPMLASGRLVGVIAAASDASRRLTASDASLLGVVASTLAVAVDNRQLYTLQQQRVERLKTLNVVSVLLTSTLDVDSVLDTITTTAGMLSEADAIALFLAAPDAEPRLGRGPRVELVRTAGLSKDFELLYAQPLIELVPRGLRVNKVPSTDTTPLDEHPPMIVTNVGGYPHARDANAVLAAEGVRAL
ncbi:MAG: GAF domain-containing protein, partial [Chloroflexota bacterium]